MFNIVHLHLESGKCTHIGFASFRVKQYQSFWGRSREHRPEGCQLSCSQDIYPQDAEANPPSQASCSEVKFQFFGRLHTGFDVHCSEQRLPSLECEAAAPTWELSSTLAQAPNSPSNSKPPFIYNLLLLSWLGEKDVGP